MPTRKFSELIKDWPAERREEIDRWAQETIAEMRQGEQVKDVRFTDDTLDVDLVDGRTIIVPLDWFPTLLKTTSEQRNNWQLSGAGYGIHWPDIDEDLSTEGLLRGAPAVTEDFKIGPNTRIVPKDQRRVMPLEAFEPRNTRVRASLYLDLDVLDFFKSLAALPGAQPYAAQINGALRGLVEGAEGKAIEKLRAQVEELQDVCAQAYQLAGVVGARANVLDILDDAAAGRPIEGRSFLPISKADLRPDFS